MNAMLANVQNVLLDYAKLMPKTGKANILDFEVWGKGFCEKMVSRRVFGCLGLTLFVSQTEYKELTEALGKKQAGVVQSLVDKVVELFGPMACQEWVSLGG
jgi:hypothetical protein